MRLALLPLLASQRSLYDLPRGWDRFREYLAVMIGGTDDIALPLAALNPMGKEHVASVLDELLAMDAEGVAGRALAEATERLGGFEPPPPPGAETAPERYELALVVADDLGGGWTDRELTEMKYRFEPRAEVRRGWFVTLLWTSVEWTPEAVRAAVLAQVFRRLWYLVAGRPRTLGAMMEQEGLAARFAGAAEPALEADDLAYTREVLAPLRASDRFPELFAALWGDEAARSKGHSPLGLSARAGLALALAEANARPDPPERVLARTVSE